MAGRVSLETMAEAAQDRAVFHAGAADLCREHGVPSGFERHRKDAETFQAMAKMFRIMATFEDRSRKFVTELLAEYRG